MKRSKYETKTEASSGRGAGKSGEGGLNFKRIGEKEKAVRGRKEERKTQDNRGEISKNETTKEASSGRGVRKSGEDGLNFKRTREKEKLVKGG